MKVRIKTKKRVFDKGDVATFSRDIYQIIDKKGQNNTLKNLNTGQEIKRTYTDEELSINQKNARQDLKRKRKIMRIKDRSYQFKRNDCSKEREASDRRNQNDSTCKFSYHWYENWGIKKLSSRKSFVVSFSHEKWKKRVNRECIREFNAKSFKFCDLRNSFSLMFVCSAFCYNGCWNERPSTWSSIQELCSLSMSILYLLPSDRRCCNFLSDSTCTSVLNYFPLMISPLHTSLSFFPCSFSR